MWDGEGATAAQDCRGRTLGYCAGTSFWLCAHSSLCPTPPPPSPNLVPALVCTHFLDVPPGSLTYYFVLPFIPLPEMPFCLNFSPPFHCKGLSETSFFPGASLDCRKVELSFPNISTRSSILSAKPTGTLYWASCQG